MFLDRDGSVIAKGSFINFVNNDMTKLINREGIPSARDFVIVRAVVEELAKDKSGELRFDRLSILCARLIVFGGRQITFSVRSTRATL